MPAVRKLPDVTLLMRLRDKGWTLAEIAQEYGVSESAVWKALERAGKTDAVPTYRDLLPWDIAPEHRSVGIMQRFRSIVRQRKGDALPPHEEKLLNEWLEGLEKNNLVVAYHKEAPPNAASRKGGFYYVPREPQDEWIIRKPVVMGSMN